MLQKRPSLIISSGGGAHDDVHAPDLLDLVVVDLWEDDVLLDAKRVVAAAIEAFRVKARGNPSREATQSLSRRSRNSYMRALRKRNFAADRHVVAQLEAGD